MLSFASSSCDKAYAQHIVHLHDAKLRTQEGRHNVKLRCLHSFQISGGQRCAASLLSSCSGGRLSSSLCTWE